MHSFSFPMYRRHVSASFRSQHCPAIAVPSTASASGSVTHTPSCPPVWSFPVTTHTPFGGKTIGARGGGGGGSDGGGGGVCGSSSGMAGGKEGGGGSGGSGTGGGRRGGGDGGDGGSDGGDGGRSFTQLHPEQSQL